MITAALSGRQAALLATVVTLTLGTVVAAPAEAATAGRVAAHGGRSGHDADGYRQINLVSDVPGLAQVLDPNLVNAWGLSAGPTSPIWVSDNGTSKSTLYRGATKPGEPASIVPLVVSIPGGGSPTGQVFNSTGDFALPSGGKAFFVFAGENGDISAWNPAQGSTAVLVAPSRGGVYKGLALVAGSSGNRLLAANFAADRIDVFDGAFQPVPVHGFRSVGIPHGYAPFNVAVLDGRVYVSYAKQDADKHDDVAGSGHGFVNVFSTSGKFLHRFASRGVLNSPWGMTIAPEGFGDFSGKVLVGNFGDGRIYAFDRSGKMAGTLRRADGHPLAIDGLWALMPGNGTAGATSDLWFSAGPAEETHGLLGILRSLGDD
ncbi:TIGR03118 family protein [Jatrophihabitans sp.]|uniref:TIGR03118 family protein n=1 Tax=Jatrophihabitans sp. TaxID=1932789 RepID=UPI002CCDCE31|nr:TIGR03118 family protein [Jatrophihabitans sp.]